MADAEDVVRGITPNLPGSPIRRFGSTTRVSSAPSAVHGILDVKGYTILAASPTFLKRNQNRNPQEQLAAQRAIVRTYKRRGIAGSQEHAATSCAAFGCNFEERYSPAGTPH